jgi:cation-transporting P-type ATPase 13A2
VLIYSSFTALIPEASKITNLQSSRRKGDGGYRKLQGLIHTMATCHSLRVVEGELLGDPLDIKMFEFTGWSFEEGGNTSSDMSMNRHDTIFPSVARPPPLIGDTQTSPGISEVGLILPDNC